MSLEELIGTYVKLTPLDANRQGGICPTCGGNVLKVNIKEQVWGCQICEVGGGAREFEAFINRVMGL